MQRYETEDEVHMFDPADIRHIAEIKTEAGSNAILVQIAGVPMPVILTPKPEFYEQFRNELLADQKYHRKI